MTINQDDTRCRVWCVGGAFVILLALVSETVAQQVRFDPFTGSRGKSTSRPASVDAKIIPHIELTGSDLDMALKMVSDLTGWSIFTSDKSRGKKVSLWATNISADDLLDRVVTLAGLMHVRTDNIVNVMTYEEYQQYYGVKKKVIQLKHGQAAEVARTVTPFLTPRGELLPHPESNSLVLYEVEVNVPLIEEVIHQIDMPAERAVLEVIQLQHADATALAMSLRDIFQPKTTVTPAQQTAQPKPGAKATTRASAGPTFLLFAEHRVEIHPVAPTNHLVVRGYRDDVDLVKELVTRLDAPGATEVKNYTLRHVMAYEAYYTLNEFLRVPGQGQGQQDSGVARLSIMEETNSVVLRAPEPIHRMVAEFIKCIDIPLPEEAGGIRTYRLENADAQQVAQIITELIEREWEDRQTSGRGQRGRLPRQPGWVTSPSQSRPPGSGRGQGSAGLVRTSKTPPPSGPKGPRGAEGAATPVVERAERPQVSYSEQTNSVVIKATIREHEQFARLIEELDRRPYQVLIETAIVEIRGNDDIDVGVELESFQPAGDSAGHLLFTAFGLSTLDTSTGERTVLAAPGGTAAVIRHNEVPAILHALANTGRANIRAAPSLLVNDNTEGNIQSVVEEPTSQVNASDTVATTSFGGFVQAGVQFAIRPHISEEDYIRVEYEVTLSSFRGITPDPALPPARDTATVTSEATVPDGHCIIIGGLNSTTTRKTVDKIPFLGDIPGLGELFKRTVTTDDVSRLYVFMTPMVLRDDKFLDLKRISDRTRNEAGEEESYPQNEMMELPALEGTIEVPDAQSTDVGPPCPAGMGVSS